MGFFTFFKRSRKPENSDLEKIMREMSVRPDMKVRRVLYLQLLKCTLLVPTPSPLGASTQGAPLKSLQLVTQPGTEGGIVWLVFTSRTALRQWRPGFEDAYVAMRGDQLFSLAVQNRVEEILVNPAGPIGGKITRMELEMLAEGTLPQEGGGKTHTVRAREQTPIRIGTPAQPLKQDLVDHLRQHLKSRPDVLAGYVAAMVIGEGKAHLILGIQFAAIPDHKEVKPLMDAIGGGIPALLSTGEYLDMVPFDEKHEWFGALRQFGILVYQQG
jgi:hypothetical protein